MDGEEAPPRLVAPDASDRVGGHAPAPLTMLAACVIAVLSVLLGAAVGFSRRIGDRHLGPVRTFAFAAALAVVFGQFLPDALEGIGGWAALPFAIGVGAPWLLERLTSRVSRASRSIGLEVGYLGLLVHQLGDGVGMGTYTGPLHEGHSHTDVFLAIGGHTVPVAAMVVVAFLRAKGPKVAAVRALGLALAVVSGVAAARLLSVSVVERNHAAISGLVGGLLLHIAAHDLRANLPSTLRERVLDWVAGAAGLLVVIVTSGGHEHEHLLAAASPAAPEPLAALPRLSLAVAPALFGGLVLSAIVHALGQRALEKRARRESEPSGSLVVEGGRGALLAALLPACACGTLPVAERLRAGGGGPALVAGFLLVAPSAGADTFLVTASSFGFGTALGRTAAVVVIGVATAVMVGLVSRARQARSAQEPSEPPALFAASGETLAARAAASLDELSHHTLPWMVVGLVVASYASAVIPPGVLANLSTPSADLVAILVLSIPGYICATSATPLAAVLLAKGLPPGVVLVGLVAGPALHVATIGWTARTYGRGAGLVLVAGVSLGALGLGFAAPLLLPSLGASVTLEGGSGSAAVGGLVGVGLLALGASFRRGIRGFFASLLDRSDPGHTHHGDGVHDHGDGCDHDHDHDHFHAHVVASASDAPRLSAHGH